MKKIHMIAEKIHHNCIHRLLAMVLTDEARSSEVNILARPKSPAQPMQTYIHLFQMKLEIKYCVNVQD